jgi:hypothetical protein
VVGTPPGEFYVTATLDRLEPGWITVATLPGWLLGGLLGWLVTGWVSRRTEAASDGVRVLTRLAALGALLLLVPPALLGTVRFVVDPFTSGPPVQPFWSLSVTWGFGCGVLGLALLLVALLAAAVGGRPTPDLAPPVTDR